MLLLQHTHTYTQTERETHTLTTVFTFVCFSCGTPNMANVSQDLAAAKFHFQRGIIQVCNI